MYVKYIILKWQTRINVVKGDGMGDLSALR